MEIITASLEALESEHTAHSQGLKWVFLRNKDTETKITQVAYGKFAHTDYCELHKHDTMEECFFFLKGKGFYIVGSDKIDLRLGVFVRIPAGTSHRLEASESEPLEYIYFGIATE